MNMTSKTIPLLEASGWTVVEKKNDTTGKLKVTLTDGRVRTITLLGGYITEDKTVEAVKSKSAKVVKSATKPKSAKVYTKPEMKKEKNDE